VRLPVRLGLALVVVASMSLVISASAFSNTEADRTVSVNVVEDGDAYVGLTYNETVSVDLNDTDPEGTARNGEIQRRQGNALAVQNQFGIRIDVEVLGDESETPELRYETEKGSQTARLAPGVRTSFDAVVTCELGVKNDKRTVDVEVTAEGEGVSAEVVREVTVVCEGIPEKAA
jgi:hypothetical protein